MLQKAPSETNANSLAFNHFCLKNISFELIYLVFPTEIGFIALLHRVSFN